MDRFQPLEKHNRLPLVDALRGLCLFFIFIANLPLPQETTDIYDTRRFILGSPQFDNILSTLVHLFIDKKFVAIFSILFGFGFYMQLRRAEDKGVAFKSYFIKRMLILLLIGCAHAYLFWFGDIIRDYAICGIFLLLIYRWPTKWLFITAILFSIFLTGLIFILNGIVNIPYPYSQATFAEFPITPSYWRYLQINFTVDPFRNFIQDSPITLVFAFGNMMMGVILARIGFFSRPGQFKGIMARLIILGATVGVSCSYLFWLISSGKVEITAALIWLPFIIVTGLLLQSLFYVSAFIKLFVRTRFRKLLLVFAPVGRMPMTNYILQSIIYLFVFFHCLPGLKLYGRITPVETYFIAILFFAIQIIWSRWWLKTHEQGPVEFLWKKFAYKISKDHQKKIKNIPVPV
jgi:uncharacterized protein